MLMKSSSPNIPLLGMDNVDTLVAAWGLDNFDYAIMHFDNSSAEWNRY